MEKFAISGRPCEHFVNAWRNTVILVVASDEPTVYSYLLEAIQKDVSVEILVLPDNGLMHYGKFHLNLAAGLEDSMIRDIAPRWNGPKRSRAKDEVATTLIYRRS